MSSLPYLLKRLRQLGFNQKIRTTVYKSMGLSHIAYSAPLLSSVNSTTKAEISNFHSRILRILNIKPEETAKHKVQNIHDFIDSTCCKLLKRIIAEPEHPLTAKLHRTTRRRSSIGYKPSKIIRKQFRTKISPHLTRRKRGPLHKQQHRDQHEKARRSKASQSHGSHNSNSLSQSEQQDHDWVHNMWHKIQERSSPSPAQTSKQGL